MNYHDGPIRLAVIRHYWFCREVVGLSRKGSAFGAAFWRLIVWRI